MNNSVKITAIICITVFFMYWLTIIAIKEGVFN
jgi:hypothetical protein